MQAVWLVMEHAAAWPRRDGLEVDREGKSSSESLLLVLEVAAGEFLLELLDAAGGVHEGLLAGEEGVGSGPNFHSHLGDGSAHGHDVLTSVGDLAVVVLGVDVLLHGEAPNLT